MGYRHNARVMYAFSFILQLVHSLAQSQYLDEYILKVAERISSHGNLAVGTLYSIAGITKLLVALPIGCLVDWRPDRRTRLAWVAVALGCPVVGLAVVAILAERLWMLAVMQVAFVIFAEFASCLAMAIFADSLSAASSNLRTAAFANVQVFQNLGTAVGSGAFSLFLLSQGPELQTDIWTGFRAKSALLTGFGLLFPVMLSLLAFRRAPQSTDSEHTEMKGERVMQRAWVPYLVLLALFFFALATGMIFKFFPLFFINIYNMSCVQISVMQTFDPLLKAGFTYAVGACAQHVGRAQAASLCIAGIIGCLLGMSYLCSGSGTDVWSLVALVMFRGSLGHASFPLIWSILMEHAPASQLGRWSSTSAVLNVSWSGSAAISGALLDQHGYAYTFQVAAVLFAVALAVFSPLLFVQKFMESQSLAVEDEEEGGGFTARQVVVVVDPFSTGGNLAAELLSQGYAVIALWTKESNVRYHDYPECLDPKKLLAELDEQPTVEGTAQRLCEATRQFFVGGGYMFEKVAILRTKAEQILYFHFGAVNPPVLRSLRGTVIREQSHDTAMTEASAAAYLDYLRLQEQSHVSWDCVFRLLQSMPESERSKFESLLARSTFVSSFDQADPRNSCKRLFSSRSRSKDWDFEVEEVSSASDAFGKGNDRGGGGWLTSASGAESVCNRLHTSKAPVSLFVSNFSVWNSMTGIQLDCSHVSGEKKEDADLLSRRDGTSPLRDRFTEFRRVCISLKEFWDICDSGVNITDALSEALNLLGNGTLSSGHRRDKWVQQEVATFAETEQYPLVVKPIESAGADGFKLCQSVEEARAHFEFLNTSQRWCGGQGGGVVLQEFLQGPEYVVDQVSRDAVHKTTMVWMYDFQEVNGSRVCVAQRPVSSETMVARELIAYACSCLDALSIRNGASHTELIWTSLGPHLVEVNPGVGKSVGKSVGGGTGFWLPLCRKMTGYCQMDAVIDVYLNQEAFHALPNAPTFLMSGDIIHLISYEEHLITAMPGLEIFLPCSWMVSPAPAPSCGEKFFRSFDDLVSASGAATAAKVDYWRGGLQTDERPGHYAEYLLNLSEVCASTCWGARARYWELSLDRELYFRSWIEKTSQLDCEGIVSVVESSYQPKKRLPKYVVHGYQSRYLLQHHGDEFAAVLYFSCGLFYGFQGCYKQTLTGLDFGRLLLLWYAVDLTDGPLETDCMTRVISFSPSYILMDSNCLVAQPQEVAKKMQEVDSLVKGDDFGMGCESMPQVEGIPLDRYLDHFTGLGKQEQHEDWHYDATVSADAGALTGG
ncbi:Argininosuccinate lyase 2 [Symbiodinium microadriaticum]|uniref:Argininosuccinate lyase 2 n=1 Tax=Symbiodinium microadriaticum TaxID=2951 RepID=A0A1Q9DJH0_SYMMI|nr:Argininosuccinate lyase 2 [Symbiodinium microadriaticum]